MTDTYTFQAEINQLMSLIINTFYSNKDIFLRELISNASDAIEKERHSLLTKNCELPLFNIQIIPNKEAKTLTIIDNGIGMSKEDLISNLGTIANSGTKEFLRKLVEENSSEDSNMIGQFGVGFYSAYLVSDNVKVYSGNNCWESNAGGTFTITELDKPETENGCKLVLSIKEEALMYLEESKLKEVVKTHSQFIDYPIKLFTTRVETKEVEDDSENDNKEGDIEEVVEETTEKQKKTVKETVEEFITLNDTKPIWLRKDDVSTEEYNAFYKALTNAWDEPIKVKTFSAEGQIEYKALLFIPKNAPFDMFNSKKKKPNIKLYVKRVLIMDKCEDLIPEWLQFISGVVDSDDLPLNVSREMLQQNTLLNVIKRNLVKKCIEMFTELAEEDDQTNFKQFYDQFSTSIKLGLHEDSKNKDKLSKLLRFYTAKSKDSYISFDEYIDKMAEDQKDIYYITGESKSAVENSPFVKGMLEKGFDVMFMTDPIDEYMFQSLTEYNDKKFVNITKNNSSFTMKNEELEKHLCEKMKDVLKIQDVVISSRLHKDPCCIVSPEYGWTANMRRIMKAQAMQVNNGMGAMMNSNDKNILEINPNHPMIMKLQEGLLKNSMNDKTLSDIIHLIYETAMVSSGYSHDDPSFFTSRIYKIIGISISAENDHTEESEDETNTTHETETETETVPSEPSSKMEELD
jgi:molecular chaperone HtpG